MRFKPLFFIVLFGVLTYALSSGLLGSMTPAVESGDVKVVFCQTENCSEAMLTVIGAAKEVKCAFYDLGYLPLESALAAKEAEVLVFEENYNGFGEPIPAKYGGLMHNKFCVLDGTTVITGTMNPTENGIEKNDNTLLIIEGEVLAQNYLDEFEELAGAREQGVREVEILHNFSGRELLLQNHFCPEDACEHNVLEALRGANESIRFLTFSFTSDPIGGLLFQKAREGVNISGVFESRQESEYSEYEGFLRNGLAVRLDKNPATMHQKLFIIDESVVIVGSYNPTKNANTRNDENLLIIHDEEIAQEFLGEFERVWKASTS